MATPLQKRKLMAEINVVPYIDVMLVLLIIFMVAAPLMIQGVEVDLPEADANAITNPSDGDPIVLSVDAAGNLYINLGDNEDQPQAAAEITRRVGIAMEARPEISVFVKADRAVPYGNVVGAMVVLQRGGVSEIGFITDPLDTYPVPE